MPDLDRISTKSSFILPQTALYAGSVSCRESDIHILGTVWHLPASKCCLLRSLRKGTKQVLEVPEPRWNPWLEPCNWRSDCCGWPSPNKLSVRRNALQHRSRPQQFGSSRADYWNTINKSRVRLTPFIWTTKCKQRNSDRALEKPGCPFKRTLNSIHKSEYAGASNGTLPSRY